MPGPSFAPSMASGAHVVTWPEAQAGTRPLPGACAKEVFAHPLFRGLSLLALMRSEWGLAAWPGVAGDAPVLCYGLRGGTVSAARLGDKLI